MTGLSGIDLALVLLTFLLAGTVKGVTGMGLPTVVMALLGALISPLAAAGLLILPSIVTNLWQIAAGPALGPLLRRLWPMLLALCLGTLPGAALLAGGETGVSTTALGLALVLYAGYTLLARQLAVPPRREALLSPLVGLLTGGVTGATGVFVIPSVPYLQALGLPRDALVQALGLSFTTSTLALAAALGAHGALGAGVLGLSLLAILPALAGMWLGQRLRQRISPALFRRVFLASLLLLGAEMALRPLL